MLLGLPYILFLVNTLIYYKIFITFLIYNITSNIKYKLLNKRHSEFSEFKQILARSIYIF